MKLTAEAVYRLACGHDAPAPPPALENGDAELRPAFVDCPTCGAPRRPIGYDGSRLQLITVPRERDLRDELDHVWRPTEYGDA